MPHIHVKPQHVISNRLSRHLKVRNIIHNFFFEELKLKKKKFLQNTAEKSSEKDVTRYTETRAIDWANSPLRKTEVQPKGHQSRGTQRKST